MKNTDKMPAKANDRNAAANTRKSKDADSSAARLHEILRRSPLFRGMSEDEIESCIKESKAGIKSYSRDEMIFLEDDEPLLLMMLLEGNVAICNDTQLGKRSIIAMFDRPGELFGEVFLFLNHKKYEHYALSVSDTRILQIPKSFLFGEPKGDYFNNYHNKLIANMLGIFAAKTYYLNQRLNILSCGGLRQRIARLILQSSPDMKRAELLMNREQLADFLNTTRPSLSRELMNMQDEGLIRVDKKYIYIEDPEGLKNI